VHQAADGAQVRVRLPGGSITSAQLATLSGVSSEFGSGTLELTARGNVQVRTITDVTAVAEAIASVGLLRSPTHERVRNIVASPLSGRAGGRADVRAWVGELDAAICAEPRLAELGGRFWFSLDDGRADVSGLGAGVGVHVLDDGVALLLAGRDSGVRLAVGDIAQSLVALALRFIEVRGKLGGSLQPGVKDFLAQLIAETTPRAPTPGRIVNGDRQADPSPRQAAQSQADRVTR
jgi:precorrin-3B synthase